MKSQDANMLGPRGGLKAHARATRGWRWNEDGALLSEPVRCKREQWYLARGHLADAATIRRAALIVRFLRAGETIAQRRVDLHAMADDASGRELLGWMQAPEDVTHLQMHLPDMRQAALFERVLLLPVAERDPKCHPLASVPPWSTYRPPFEIRRVVVPASLAALAAGLGGHGQQVEVLAQPQSLGRLQEQIAGAACILDPAWAVHLRMNIGHLERLAERAWLLVDLGTLATLVNRSGVARTEAVTHTSPHEIMSARVEYADVATRGFALQDVLPYGVLAGDESFSVRVLVASRTWKRYADEVGFATLLASETPWEKRCGDVLSAARAIGRGELIATDLPWLVAGTQGRLLAPRLARHLLHMHLGGGIEDDLQYWNRWDTSDIVVRDISELARKYAPLQAVRWAPGAEGLQHLGICLPTSNPLGGGRHLLIRTGRIDNLGLHDGLPPESMIIVMKWLARNVRAETAWAQRWLANLTVTWQFDSAAGTRYATNYDSAAMIPTEAAQVVTVRCGDTTGIAASGATDVDTLIADDEGIHGDGALEFQRGLMRRVHAWIERAADGGIS
ncbi:MAG: hypothetical protein KKB50_04975 [Planctomycetes bacterium]|nr:hypothetical protein [Planctomycetota bacterium]